MSEPYATLSIERPHPEIVLLRLNRPERLNALTHPMVRELHHAIEHVAEDSACRVLILMGAGRGFCAGMDIKASIERLQGAPTGPAVRMQGQEMFAGMVKRLRAMRQPVIAAVNGPAVGAGLGLALASDIRIAGASARFLVGAIRIGLTGGECGISYHLPRYIGASRAFEIMLTGRPVDAIEAERIGLVSYVVPDDALFERAMEMAQALLANSPFSIHQTKQMMWTNLAAPSFEAALELENRAQILAALTEDFSEASHAFAEKRPPKFTGR